MILPYIIFQFITELVVRCFENRNITENITFREILTDHFNFILLF